VILRLIGRTINALYISSTPEAIVLTPGIIAAGVAVGTILSLLSAIQPSIEAAQLRPNLLFSNIRRTQTRTSQVVAAIACFIVAASSRGSRVERHRRCRLHRSPFVVAGFSALAR